MPSIKHSLVFGSATWQTQGASFSVIEMVSAKMNDKPSLQLFCRWDANDGVERFALNFPENTITYPDQTKYIASTSPIGRRDFVIHIPVHDYPTILSSISIPITCSARKEIKDFGEFTLHLRYWPTKEHLIKANSIQ